MRYIEKKLFLNAPLLLNVALAFPECGASLFELSRPSSMCLFVRFFFINKKDVTFKRQRQSRGELWTDILIKVPLRKCLETIYVINYLSLLFFFFHLSLSNTI